jgi:phosphohistidine phosphatase
MTLYILRHATAEEAGPDGDDSSRRLTDRGGEKMREAAAGMRALKLKFDLILTSPITRASETAEIVAAAYSNDPVPQVLPALATGIPPSGAASALKPFADYGDVMIVGHEPQLSALASLLVTGSADVLKVRLKQGGCIALDFPDRFERGHAELLWMMTQRQLRRARK